MAESIELLHVDSRNRDTTAYPKAWEYRLSLDETCMSIPKNVTEVELVGWCFPRIENEEYVVLEISELGARMQSSDNNSTNKFATLFFDNYNLPKGEIKPMKGSDYDRKVIKFSPPLPALPHLTIKFTKFGGDISASEITPSGGLGGLEAGRNILLLKITSRDRPHEL